jgi:hypothetical protein
VCQLFSSYLVVSLPVPLNRANKMALTAPFSNAMRPGWSLGELYGQKDTNFVTGQGFNTYTQELRLEGAVEVTFSKPTTFARKENGTIPSPSDQTIFSPPSGSAPNVSVPPPSPSEPRSPSPPLVQLAIANGVEALLDSFLPATNGDGAPRVESDPVIPRPTPELKESANAQKAKQDEATLLNSAAGAALPFFLPKEYEHNSSQSVTYSARSIDNMSDIMDALNISASASIKYGTIHGNASAGFVNENKVLNSELSYVVTVTVNNNTHAEPATMVFQAIEDLPAEDFTDVYGDAFMSGKLLLVPLTCRTFPQTNVWQVSMKVANLPP